MSLRILEHGFLFEQHSVKTQNISSACDWEKCAFKDLMSLSFFSLNVEIILVFQINWDDLVTESRWIPLRLFYLRLKLKKKQKTKKHLIVTCHHWQGVSRAVFRFSGIQAEHWGLWPWLRASPPPLELRGGEKELLPPNSVKGGDSSSSFTPDDLS